MIYDRAAIRMTLSFAIRHPKRLLHAVRCGCIDARDYLHIDALRERRLKREGAVR